MRINSLVLIVFLLILSCGVLAQTATAPSAGNGTSGSPYQIANLENLYWIVTDSTNWTTVRYYIQTADIDASATTGWFSNGSSGYYGWIPIGSGTKTFKGSYNGNSKTVNGLYINRPSTNYIGLFGDFAGTSSSSTATISNLGVTNVNITGAQRVGALVGRNSAYANLVNCYGTGSIVGTAYVGGFLGVNSATVRYCYTTCSVNGSNATGQIGGFVGWNGSGATLENCYCTGNVKRTLSGIGSAYGGFCGWNESKIMNSYSTGKVEWTTTTNPTDKGFCGNVNTSGINYSMSGNFWDTQTSVQSTTAGTATGETTTDMKTLSTYTVATWDFKGLGISGIWNISTGYPYLAWQSPADPAPSTTVLPTVTTQAVNSITATSATFNGTITNTGNPSYTSHGFCWGTSINPTTQVSGGTVIAGVYTYNNSTLTVNTTYYVRAFATNSNGTSYGNEVSFVTSSAPTGSGTSGDPYQIASLGNLYWITETTVRWSKYYIQTADINASETSAWNGGAGWIPIGNATTNFTGNYNGNNKTISGLFINRPTTNYVGLFGYTTGSTISNLWLTGLSISGDNFVGGLVGHIYNNTTISGSHSAGAVTGTGDYIGGLVGYSLTNNTTRGILSSYSLCYVTGKNRVGGLVGDCNNTKIDNSYSTGNVNGTSDYIGGLVGHNVTSSTITNSHSTSVVSSSSGANIGGLVGFNATNSTIDNCYSTGNVTGYSYVGGLVGQNYGADSNNSSTITKSYSSSVVIATNQRAGGLVGSNSASHISSSFSSGSVSGSDVTGNLGGFVGWNGSNATIVNCYSLGNVKKTTAVAGTNYGGFCGNNDKTITNSYSTGKVEWTTTANPTNKGFCGTVGTNSAMSGNFWDTQTSLQSTTAGTATGKTTTEMKTLTTFTLANWDFKGLGSLGIWNIGNNRNNGYPYLDWQYPGDATLPVELSAFTAITTPQNFVQLDWTTQSETNVSGYYLFRNTTNNLSTAERLNAFIAATNTSNETAYSFTDREAAAGYTWYYWLQHNELSGEYEFHGPISVSLTGNSNINPVIPVVTALKSIYPNPFNPDAIIPYDVAKAGKVTLEVYNIKGEKVRSLLSETKNAGRWHLAWNGTNDAGQSCTTGVYYVKMTSGKYSCIRKVVLLK